MDAKDFTTQNTTEVSTPSTLLLDPFAVPVETQTDKEKIGFSASIFLFFSKQDIPYVIVGFICMMVSSLGSPVQTVVYGLVFKDLSKLLGRTYDFGHFVSKVRFNCGLIMIVGGVRSIFTWLGFVVWMQFGERQQIRARKQLFDLFFKRKIEWYDTKVSLMGEIAQANRCIEELRSGNAEVLGILAQTCCSIIFLLITSMYHSWSLTFVFIASSPLMALSTWYFGRLTYRYADLENNITSKGSKLLDWNFMSGDIVRLFNGKISEIFKFNEIVDDSATAFYKMTNALSVNVGILRALSLIAVVQGFWFGNYMIRIGKLEISQVFTSFATCVLLGSNIGSLADLVATLNKAKAAAITIANFSVESDNSNEHGESPNATHGHIEFRDIGFKYPNRNERALGNFNLNIEAGTLNFIVGKSGSGKSTVSQLFLKFYHPDNGKILLDGKNIEEISSDWLFENTTLIQLDSIIFDTTLKENVSLAVVQRFLSIDDTPELMIEDACEFALLSHFISELPKGYNNKVSSSSLSGGQKQKIALARAKIRDTPILILDEAVSAVDIKDKELLLKSIKQWRRGRTTIIITHETNYIGDGDNVILMENGQVKAEGLYNDLKKENLITKANLDLERKPFDAMEEDKENIKGGPSRFSLYEQLRNPVILQDLEKQVPGVEMDERPEDLMTVLSILNYCRKTIDAKIWITFGIFSSIISAVVTPVFSYCLSKLLLNMVNSSIDSNKKYVSADLILWSSIIIGLSLFDGFVSYISLFLLNYSGERWIVNLRKLVFNKISDQSMAFFDTETTKPAELTALLMNDTRDLRNLVSEFLKVSIVLIVMLLTGIIWSILSGWKLSLVGISFVPLILLVTGVYNRLLEVFENKYKNSIAELENSCHETASGLKTIFSLNLNDHFSSVFELKLFNIKRVAFRRSLSTSSGIALQELCTSVATATILYYGMFLVANSDYSQTQLLEVTTILSMTLTHAGSLLKQIPEIARGQRVGTYLIKILGLPSSPCEVEGNLKLHKLYNSKDLIRFNDLSFHHPNRISSALLNVCFKVAKGETISLVGQSGLGKSTIVSLLTRLFDIDSNQIYLSNYDIKNIEVERLRELIAIVPQTPKFFEGTIYENLTYGLGRGVNQEKVLDALIRSNSYEFISSLPLGLDTIIGGGLNCLLSTGQLQRLSITRALLRSPQILILDECTANLDPENTAVIFKLIHELAQTNLTIIIITHEVEMMQLADKLVVLKNGRVSEIGSFDTLYGRRGELFSIIKDVA